MKVRGLSAHRFRDNPEERRFAEAWNQVNTEGRILDYLLASGDWMVNLVKKKNRDER